LLALRSKRATGASEKDLQPGQHESPPGTMRRAGGASLTPLECCYVAHGSSSIKTAGKRTKRIRGQTDRFSARTSCRARKLMAILVSPMTSRSAQPVDRWFHLGILPPFKEDPSARSVPAS